LKCIVNERRELSIVEFEGWFQQVETLVDDACLPIENVEIGDSETANRIPYTDTFDARRLDS
jgi:hypothetical protein